MQGYWLILTNQAIDQAAYEQYARLWIPIAERYQARITVLNTSTALVETSGYSRALVVEFESYSQALACYQDEAYQDAKSFALKASARELLVLQGEPPRG